MNRINQGFQKFSSWLRRSGLLLFATSFLAGIATLILAVYIFLQTQYSEDATKQVLLATVVLARDLAIIPSILMFLGTILIVNKFFFLWDYSLFANRPETKWMPLGRAGMVGMNMLIIFRITIPFAFNQTWYSMSGAGWDILPNLEGVVLLAAGWYISETLWARGIRNWRSALLLLIVLDIIVLTVGLVTVIFLMESLPMEERVALLISGFFAHLIVLHVVVTYVKALQERGVIIDEPKIIDSSLAERIYHFLRLNPMIPILSGALIGLSYPLGFLVRLLRFAVLEEGHIDQTVDFLHALSAIIYLRGLVITVFILSFACILLIWHNRTWDRIGVK